MKEEKALVPKLRFQEYRDAEGWHSTVLGEVSEVVRGGSPRPIDGFLTPAVDGLNWLKTGDVDKEAKYVNQTTEIGLPSNLFYSTGIPVCILVLKKCKKPDDVLFINAAEHFVKGKRQNQLTDAHIAKIIKAYQFRQEEARYSRRVGMAEIEKNDFNLNISRYISTAVEATDIDLERTHDELVAIEASILEAKQKHNAFLKELGLSPLP